MTGLDAAGFKEPDKQIVINSLRGLTNQIINPENGLWLQDRQKIENLEWRRNANLSGDQGHVSKIYWLLEDCKRYGTLPFAGLARAAFIAVQLLQSLVRLNVISFDDRERFMNSLNTISGSITQDFERLSKNEFLSRYGHLRPGTYDILSPRYDENPELYFSWEKPSGPSRTTPVFSLSATQEKALNELFQEHGLCVTGTQMFDFMRGAIEAREYAKFLFSRNLSDAIQLIDELGAIVGLDPESLSYANIRTIYEAYSTSIPVRELLVDSIMLGKETMAAARQIILPQTINDVDDVMSFSLAAGEPNFITNATVTAPVSSFIDRNRLSGSIVMIPSADPGFDWLFSHNIGGLITAYGGVNSHMAIRAAELQLPAVIGAGEVLFQKWQQADVLTLDCATNKVTIVRAGGQA